MKSKVKQNEPGSSLLMFFMGVFLGLLQMGYVFSVHMMLSSTFNSYLYILTAWLIGGIIGVCSKRMKSLPLVLLAAVISYAISQFLLSIAPFHKEFLVVHASLSSSGGILGGVLFKLARPWFTHVRDMFFHENNGFLCGIIAAFIGTTLYGHAFVVIAPMALAAMTQFARLCTGITVMLPIRSGNNPYAIVTSPSADFVAFDCLADRGLIRQDYE